MRSRERKKTYVKDLEMKSKYLEGECRRLGRLLQCCYAENQALRFNLQMGNTFGATTTKQESAVLLLGMNHQPSCPYFLYLALFFSLGVVFHALNHEKRKRELRKCALQTILARTNICV